MNKQKGNMYEFVTHTWNTVKGECPHGCSYCYMKRWGTQKELHFDDKEMRADLGNGNFIFVGSSCDMWEDDVPSNWIEATINKCHSGNQYLFQTKNPRRFLNYVISGEIPFGAILCTTLETNYTNSFIVKKCPSPVERASAFAFISSSRWRKFITIEPIMDFNLKEFVEMIKKCNPEQVNIGADTGNHNLPEPSAFKIDLLIDELSKFTKIENKRNLGRIMDAIERPITGGVIK